MLVLSRKKGQSLMIGDNIEVSIVDISGDQVKIGIKAPKNIAVHREEIYREIKNENARAACPDIARLKEFGKKENREGKEHGNNDYKGEKV